MTRSRDEKQIITKSCVFILIQGYSPFYEKCTKSHERCMQYQIASSKKINALELCMKLISVELLQYALKM